MVEGSSSGNDGMLVLVLVLITWLSPRVSSIVCFWQSTSLVQAVKCR